MDIYWFYGWLACSASFGLGWVTRALLCEANKE